MRIQEGRVGIAVEIALDLGGLHALGQGQGLGVNLRAADTADFIGVDLRGLRARVDAARDALFARAGVPVDGNWLPRPFDAPATQ